MTRWWGWIVCVSICVIGGAASGLSVVPAMQEWYPSVIKPEWTPPNRVFGPIWTALYILMGVSAWLVIRRTPDLRRSPPLRWFAVQLLLNWLWSPIFFGAHWIGFALIEILALWLAIAVTMKQFWPVSRLAAGLLLPYLGWVSIATALTHAIWRLNP